MSIDIVKCENGWLVRHHYANTAVDKAWIFTTLQELAEWIISNPALSQ